MLPSNTRPWILVLVSATTTIETADRRGREAQVAVIRTYETFEVVWTDDEGYRSTWDSREAAEAQVAYAAEHGSGRRGEVVRKAFEVEIAADRLHLYRPGVAERAA